MRLICIYGIAAVSFFLIFASICSISLFSFKICLLSAFLLYSIRILANLYKRLTITTNAFLVIRMACLHYVPGGHGDHVSGHRGRNVVTVRQRRGTGSTNVSHRDCRGRRGKFLNSQKICHGNHGADDLLLRT